MQPRMSNPITILPDANEGIQALTRAANRAACRGRCLSWCICAPVRSMAVASAWTTAQLLLAERADAHVYASWTLRPPGRTLGVLFPTRAR